jgi:hypothetical protein
MSTVVDYQLSVVGVPNEALDVDHCEQCGEAVAFSA